jgi:hypothetical protein
VTPVPLETTTNKDSRNADVLFADGRALNESLDHVLGRWLGLSSQYFSAREEGGGIFPLEKMLQFKDPVEGIWVFRGPAELTGVLRDALENKIPGASQGRDLFTELVVRIWKDSAQRFFKKEMKDIQPVRFKDSQPMDWPHREPNAGCLSFVGRWPMEMLIWSGSEGGKPE